MDANSAAIRGMGLFYMGLAEMEQIDSDAWFAGETDQEWVRPAIEQFERAQQDFQTARNDCSAFQEWFPEERREEITPDIEYFGRMEERLSEVIEKLNERELPTLGLVHSICSTMNEAQTIGARKAVALRGTRGHFPAKHP